MEVIYPEKTRTLLAKYDELIDKIRDDYQRMYPDPTALMREVLGEERYAERCYEVWDERRRAMLSDVFYQGFMQQKARIISRSPCTYVFDKSDWTAKEQP